MLISVALFVMSTSTGTAQIGFSLNIHAQPLWGPTNYDHVEYYYMPEYGIYYYAPGAQFVYQVGSRWTYSSRLPYKYRNVNLYSTYKVVVNESKPYLRHDYYANRYSSRDYRNMHSRQEVIRDSKDDRYREYNNHQQNSKENMRGSSKDKREYKRDENNYKKAVQKYNKDNKNGRKD